MSRASILDTGPLVAFINGRDGHHGWALEQFSRTRVLLTCEPVITETCFLLRNMPQGAETLEGLLAHDVIRVVFSLQDNYERVFQLMRKYADTPMSLADACLVCMTEDHSDSVVLTMDSDFSVYRRHDTQSIHAVFP